MRRIPMKIAAASMAVMMAVSMAGCTTSYTTTKTEATSESEANTASIANPVKEVTEQEMINETGIDLPAPEGATNVVYSIIDEGDLRISQVNFTLDGKEMYLRACETSETSFSDSSETDSDSASEATTEDEFSSISDDVDDEMDEITNILRKGDISGLNYEWSQESTQLVQDREANAHVNSDGIGYIAWIDPVPGILYNLCMESGATTENLVEYAEKVFVPLQGESDGDEEADMDITSDFNSLLDEIYDTKAGSAGSSSRVEAAAKSLVTFVDKYVDHITLQNMEALAAEKLEAMQEEYGKDVFKSNFQESLEAVAESAKSDNPEFETDVTFNQVVNGIQMVLDDME